MAETIRLAVTSAAYERPIDAERDYGQFFKTANLYSQFSQESKGFAVFFYHRTILNPTGHAIHSDSVVSVITPEQADYTRSGLRQILRSSLGYEIKLLSDAILNNPSNPDYPPPIITEQGNIHLLVAKKSRGLGYVNYLTRFRGLDQAA